MKESPEILADLLSHLKISANKLAFEIGLNANTAIYHIKNGRNGISSELAKKIINRFPEISYNWLLTGEGEILKGEKAKELQANEEQADYKLNDVQAMHQDLKKDLNSLAEGMIKNFEVISTGIMQGLMDQRKLLDWTEKIDPDKINKSSEKLEEFLKQKQEK